jgi:hypothetical protein
VATIRRVLEGWLERRRARRRLLAERKHAMRVNGDQPAPQSDTPVGSSDAGVAGSIGGLGGS